MVSEDATEPRGLFRVLSRRTVVSVLSIEGRKVVVDRLVLVLFSGLVDEKVEEVCRTLVVKSSGREDFLRVT